MKPLIAKQTVRSALSAHAAIGLLASALLYLVCVTGTLVVFYQEWQRVEQPSAPEMTAISPEAVQKSVTTLLASEAGHAPSTHLYVQLPYGGLPRTAVITDDQAMNVAPDGTLAGAQEKGWSEFLLNLHYRLMLPATWGLIIVGALGVVMVALSITGVLAHPRIFRDAFRLRARQGSGVGLADWHNRLSVWTLPFSLAVALTGAVIGLAGVTSYGLGKQFYDGDTLAAYTPIFGGEPKPDHAVGPVPDMAAALRGMKRRFPYADPYYVIVHDPLTAGQHIQILAHIPHRLIYGESYSFDAAGRFRKKAGMSDGALGKQAAASNYNLHFGNFGGLPVKIAYLIFGAALCAIIGTGPVLWLGKRRRRGMHEPKLRAAWNAVLWGIPAMLAATLVLRLIAGNAAPLNAVFWIGMAAILLVSITRAGLRDKRARESLQPA
ncbi:PepSY-associated TM helix domain-containing protein [Stakelama flava]|uniref:PepSY-associated TM helix domain-containing protein n=1 Tax=Stakelama flava TaxID=2860338 RepID=UPI0031BA6E7D